MTDAARRAAGILNAWMDEPLTRDSLAEARDAFHELAAILVMQPVLRDELSPYLLNVFVRTGYLKDYKLLSRYARRVNSPALLAEVDGVIRHELPDIWIQSALSRRDVDAAIDCWFEYSEHERARLCADELVAACPDRVDVLVSGRLSVVAYQVGRGTRSRYRRACRILQTLRKELDRAGEGGMWEIVIEDVLGQHGHRPAFVDELAKANIIESAED